VVLAARDTTQLSLHIRVLCYVRVVYPPKDLSGEEVVGPKAGKNDYEYTTEIEANQVPAADFGRCF
jgi:hypothetical protein